MHGGFAGYQNLGNQQQHLFSVMGGHHAGNF
jgi:hypothetical protein